LRVVVLVKHVPDPGGNTELGPDFLVERSGEGSLDPGDEFAVEAALRIAQATEGDVTAVSMGPSGAMAAVRRALSMGAERGVLISDDALRGTDALGTAKVLAAAVGRAGFDVIVAGVESTDGYTGTVPMTVAALMGIPALTFARKASVEEREILVERQTDRGFDQIACAPPVLVTVTAASDEPRYPTLKGIMAAKSKGVDELSLADLELVPADVAPGQRVTGVAAAPAKSGGEVIQDDGSAAARIADLLADAKVI
jgi:electron transfer flavoprotein beta subunit